MLILNVLCNKKDGINSENFLENPLDADIWDALHHITVNRVRIPLSNFRFTGVRISVS